MKLRQFFACFSMIAPLCAGYSPALAQRSGLPFEAIANHERLVNAGAEVDNFISADSITLSAWSHELFAEGAGTTDDLCNVSTTGLPEGFRAEIRATVGDTITVKNGGACNITTDTGADLILTGAARATLYVTASGVDASLGGGGAQAITSLSALGALTSASPAGTVRALGAAGRSGDFVRVTDDISNIVAIDTLNCVSYADPGTPDGSAGGWMRREWLAGNREVLMTWCGAVPMDNSGAAQSANVTALQAAINIVGAPADATLGATSAGLTPKGGTARVNGAFFLNGGVATTGDQVGVTIAGYGTREKDVLGQYWAVESVNLYRPGPSTLYFSHTSGDAIRLVANQAVVKDLEVIGTVARRDAATLGVTAGGGIWCEPVDAVSGSTGIVSEGAVEVFLGCHIENVISAWHPGVGVAMVGNGGKGAIINSEVHGNGSHGIMINNGELSGRVNVTPASLGQFDVFKTRMANNFGHGILVGSASRPSGSIVYRVTVDNVDSASNGHRVIGGSGGTPTDGPELQHTSDSFFSGINIVVRNSGFGGTKRDASLATVNNAMDCITLDGNEIAVKNNRFISCDTPIVLGSTTTVGRTEENIIIENAFVDGAGLPRPNLVEVLSASNEIHVKNASDSSRYTNVFSNESLINSGGYETSTRTVSIKGSRIRDDLIFNTSAVGTKIKASVTNQGLGISGGTSINAGAAAVLYGETNAGAPGYFDLRGARIRMFGEGGADESARFEPTAVSIFKPTNITGNVAITGNLTVTGTLPVGARTAEFQNGDYTFVADDVKDIILHQNATAHTYTVPDSGTLNYAVGSVLKVVNTPSSGDLTISHAGGALLYVPNSATPASTRVITGTGVVTLTKWGGNHWLVSEESAP